MKCANPDCNRGIGLVAYRRRWFGKRRYCSRQCRDTAVGERPKQSQQGRKTATYFEWLFTRPLGQLRMQRFRHRSRAVLR
jgi:hypothetical protein